MRDEYMPDRPPHLVTLGEAAELRRKYHDAELAGNAAAMDDAATRLRAAGAGLVPTDLELQQLRVARARAALQTSDSLPDSDERQQLIRVLKSARAVLSEMLAKESDTTEGEAPKGAPDIETEQPGLEEPTSTNAAYAVNVARVEAQVDQAQDALDEVQGALNEAEGEVLDAAGVARVVANVRAAVGALQRIEAAATRQPADNAEFIEPVRWWED